MKNRIELIVSVAVIALAAFLVVGFVRSGLAPWDHPLLPKVARAGETLPAIAGLEPAAEPATLVMAIRKGCEYCEASMPFYQRLAALSRAHELRAGLFAALPGDRATAASFLAAHQLAIPFAAEIPLNGIEVAGTPTLILIDGKARILHVWVGELTQLGQQQVLAAVARKNAQPSAQP